MRKIISFKWTTLSHFEINFECDSQGGRSSKTAAYYDGTNYFALSTNYFIYDGWNLIAEIGPETLSGAVICGV